LSVFQPKTTYRSPGWLPGFSFSLLNEKKAPTGGGIGP
jgi:hypothetical protein